jgi:two-component system, sporulation sensor kinase E
LDIMLSELERINNIVTEFMSLAKPQNIQIQIHDQGQGISEEVIRKIGEPFLTTKKTGTGLGLMICHRIIEAHQGTFQITSNDDMGTTVSITLPIHMNETK